jgi:alkylation response protein AidB-like acyl-CoA dehydrogenase
MSAISNAVLVETIHAPSDYETLAAAFRPHFKAIAEGAAERDQRRELPRAEVSALLKAGFGALRIPQRYGGSGASISQLFRLLIELGEADSNIVQIFRIQFGFVENLLHEQDISLQQKWFDRIVKGAFVGAAMSEQSAVGDITVRLLQRNGHWYVDGEKYYSTGALFADWINVIVKEGDDYIDLVIPVRAEGVTLVDDWDGFGQKLTGSGTTRFENVRVEDDQILHRFPPETLKAGFTYVHPAFYQQVHLATLAGIARAVLRDAVHYVRGRTRVFLVPGTAKPQDDPLVQRVIGRLSSLSFALDSIVEGVSAKLDAAYERQQSGDASDDDPAYIEADLAAFQGQQIAIDLVLQATSLLFEVGGASAVRDIHGLDRHWRNARTLASHNPAILREAVIGAYRLKGVSPRA